MLAIVAMFALATVPGSIDEADAAREKTENAVPIELEPDVDLSLKQATEPRQSSLVPTETTKGYEPKSSDSDAVTYQVAYRIQNDGTTDVKNITISVQSDTETVEAKLSGELDVKRSIITVFVKAIDPATIEAKIVGFEI